MRKITKNNKGQMTIIGLLSIFILLVVYGAFLPTINTEIANALPHLSGASALLLQMFNLFVVVAILSTIMIFVQVRYR